ncbi:hypothetical protein HaLaN_09351, partial [Haematococcus lacustris]
TEDSKWYRKQLAPTLQLPQTEYTQDYTDLLAHALAKLDNCAAVEGLCVSSAALASLLSHPPLALQLQQLDLTDDSIPDSEVPEAVGNMFQEAIKVPVQIKEVELRMRIPENEIISLALLQQQRVDLAQLISLLQPLQCCCVDKVEGLEGLSELLPARPQLHTLQLPGATVREQDLGTLLAATRITSVHLGVLHGLDAPGLPVHSDSSHALLDLWRHPHLHLLAVAPGWCQVSGAATEPMCESLRLMAGQPWARWLDIKVSAAGRPLPACCLNMNKVFNNSSQPGRIK